MQAFGVIYAAIIIAFGLFLTAGGYVLQRDRYWKRVWRDLGKPQVETIKELKALSKEQTRSVSSRKRTELLPNH